ncbi:MAG: nuclear transport factor 2 family protein [Gammaproteobacteria bacterium]|nr:nuclear transport factor 2 family protein [Gammaproteobacteria bacterium]
MTPTVEERDVIFKKFGRAFFKQDMEAMYEVVHPTFTWTVLVDGVVRKLQSREAIEAYFAERKGKVLNTRFEDVVYHHSPDATFMTYRMTGTDAASGDAISKVGIERYTFEGGMLAVKDVYSRDES